MSQDDRTARVIDAIIRREGGYSDHPDDRGGKTMYGITEDVARRYGYDGPMRELPLWIAREIYEEEYVRRPRLDRIADDRLFALLVDSAVQHGPRRAIQWLQQVLGVTADGIIGPKTLAALERHDPNIVYREVLAHRIAYYMRIVARDPVQVGFARGWARRIAEIVA